MGKKEQNYQQGGVRKKKGRIGFVIAILALLLVLAAVVGLFVLKQGGGAEGPAGRAGFGDQAAPEAEAEAVFAVNTTLAVLGPIADYFQINGEIVTASSVDTYADTQGILARLNVGLGDYVTVGQVIAEVDPSRPGLTFALSPVKAKVAGTITALPLVRGDAVGPQTPVATIGDLGRLQVVTAIPERFISRIRRGMTAEVYLEAWPGHVIPLTVSEIDPVVDPSSRTLEVRMDIPRGETKAKAGMYAEIRLTTDEKDQVVKVPSDTVLRRLGETFVYVVENDVARKRLVVPGITLGGVVEIVEGLDAGESVVYQGQTLLEDGVKVRVVRTVQPISG
jgi:multidrug efflux pump subunit AcrA (membrane-fusion protein)